MYNPGKLLNVAAWGIVAMMGVSLSGTGCGANHYAVQWNPTLDGNQASALVIDAQQRAIVASPVSHPSANNGSVVMYCAEPSPDALVAMSSALAASASGSFFNKADIKAQLQQAVSQAATELGRRSESIQLLRDAGYRLCEARMNGFITNGTFPVSLNRLEDGMVTLLAIEQLSSPNQNQTPVTITAPSVAGDLNVNAPSGQSSAVPSTGATKAPNKNTKATKSPAAASIAFYREPGSGYNSAPDIERSKRGQNRFWIGNAPKLELAKVSASPAAAPVPAPAPEPKPSSEAKPSSTAQSTSATGPAGVSTPSSPGPVSPEVAQAVQHMVSIYLYKNLEESCLTLAATELQATFQIAVVTGDPLALVKLNALKKMEADSHIWDYCKIIFDKFKQGETIHELESPTATPAPPRIKSERPARPAPKPAAAKFVTSAYR